MAGFLSFEWLTNVAPYSFISWQIVRLFPFLASVNNVSVNMGVQISVGDLSHISFEHTPRSGIFGSYGSTIFNFFGNIHTVLLSGCTNLSSHKNCKRLPFSPNSHLHLLSFFFLLIIILTGARWDLSVVLICTFSCTIDIYLYIFFPKCLFGSSAIVLFRFILLLSCMSF